MMLLVVVFSVTLFSPTINAVGLDPNNPWNQHHPGSFNNELNSDPWGELSQKDITGRRNTDLNRIISSIKIYFKYVIFAPNSSLVKKQIKINRKYETKRITKTEYSPTAPSGM